MDEKFGLISQIRRAVVSILSNCELETQIMLACDLEYIDNDLVKPIMDKIEKIERIPKALIKSLENKPLSKIPLSFAGNPRILES